MNAKQLLFEQYPVLLNCEEQLDKALDLIATTYRHGGKLLICGNGGSAADSEHISGELLKGFLSHRPLLADDRRQLTDVLGNEEGNYFADRLQYGLPAIPLPSFSSLLTAYSNDVDPSLAFAQLVMALGNKGDLLLGISTSGNASNVVSAAKVARARGLKTLRVTGKHAGLLSSICDVTIRAPADLTYRIQELHLPIYHYLCAEAERICIPKGEKE